MRQAVTTVILGLSLALGLSALSRGDETDVAATIDRARRLIQANDHAAATTFLEEALLEANATDRSTIIDLLRQSYEVMARQADTSGRSRDAAHYRDNLAILNRGRESSRRPKTSAELTKAPAQPKPPAKDSRVAHEPENKPPRSLPIEGLVSDLASRFASPIKPEPAPDPSPLSGPIDMAEKPSSPERSPSVMTAISGLTEPLMNPPDREADASSGTSLPVATVSPSTESQPIPETTASSRPDFPNTSVEEADRLFAVKSYDQAGRSYATLAAKTACQPAERNTGLIAGGWKSFDESMPDRARRASGKRSSWKCETSSN